MTTTPSTLPALVELRQYTLRPGRRDELIELFARELVTGQEAAGARVLGWFRDLDDPDRFVWLRGFADHASRAPALERFYFGDVWARHRAAANATMVDSDDVLQLRPVRDEGRAPRLRTGSGAVAVLVLIADEPVDDALAIAASADLEATLDRARGELIGLLATDPSPNAFPQLPIREDVDALVALTAFAEADGRDRWAGAIANWRAPTALSLRERPVTLRLARA